MALAAAAGWLYFGEIPKLRGDLTRAERLLEAERQAGNDRARSETIVDTAEGNVALVMLQASRSDEKATTVLPAGAKRLIVWIDLAPSRFRTFHLDVTTSDDRRIASLDRLERGPYGAISVSLPADTLPTGNVRIRLSGEDPSPAALIGDYQLNIQKR
jgi:hypothetical protein